jgi:sugar lactone lactonase YvrE
MLRCGCQDAAKMLRKCEDRWQEMRKVQIITPDIQRYSVPDLRLGEGAFWHEAQQALYFVDILKPALFCLNPEADTLQSWAMPESIGSFGICKDGRAIVALRTGVSFFNFATGTFTPVAQPEPDRLTNRLNDGKVGPDGRFWVGSMDDRQKREPVAALYRIDHDGTCTRLLDGLTISNGLAWSPDGATMYHSDTVAPYLQAFDYDLATGAIANQRVVRHFKNEEGRPDGAAMDREGCYWSAGVSAGCVNRISPDGTIMARFELPLAAPTMPCFGGPDYKTLFVTSLQSDRLGHDQPGTVISFQVDVAGTAGSFFGA